MSALWRAVSPQAAVFSEPAQRSLLIPPPHVEEVLRGILIDHLHNSRSFSFRTQASQDTPDPLSQHMQERAAGRV